MCRLGGSNNGNGHKSAYTALEAHQELWFRGEDWMQHQPAGIDLAF